MYNVITFNIIEPPSISTITATVNDVSSVTYCAVTCSLYPQPSQSTAAVVGVLVAIIVVLLVLLVIVPLVVALTVKRRYTPTKNDDVAHCSVNPSYDTVHSTTTNKHNIVYDEVHTTPSCTDNPAYGTSMYVTVLYTVEPLF